jgi:putative transposase
MKKLIAYKYRLYPTKEQQILLAKHFGAVRWIYNYALNKKIELYKKEKKTLSRFDLSEILTGLKKQEETSWLSEVNSQSLQFSLLNLDNAYNRFFKEKKGFPKFKSKRNKQSVQFPQYSKVNFEDNTLYIMKFKEGIKCKFSRTFEGKIKTTTISKTPTNKYFAFILVEEIVPEVIKFPIQKDKTVGIDLGIKSFLVTSNNEVFDNPKYYKQSLNKLKVEQKKISRKKLGSNNRNKQRKIVAKLHEKITNQREDFIHKVSRQLVNENQVTTYCFETLNIRGMMKNHHLAQAIGDTGWASFVNYLSYKADWMGKNIFKIGRFEPSSKTCNICGNINQNLTLKDREWVCDCGAKLDRDFNAACNIRDMGLKQIGLGKPELTLGEIG